MPAQLVSVSCFYTGKRCSRFLLRSMSRVTLLNRAANAGRVEKKIVFMSCSVSDLSAWRGERESVPAGQTLLHCLLPAHPRRSLRLFSGCFGGVSVEVP